MFSKYKHLKTSIQKYKFEETNQDNRNLTDRTTLEKKRTSDKPTSDTCALLRNSQCSQYSVISWPNINMQGSENMKYLKNIYTQYTDSIMRLSSLRELNSHYKLSAHQHPLSTDSTKAAHRSFYKCCQSVLQIRRPPHTVLC